MNTERPFAAPKTFDDAWIERWAAVYLDVHTNRVMRAWGVSFEEFLETPEEKLASVGTLPAPRVGLTPLQRAVQERLDVMAALERLSDEALAAAERAGGHTENGRVVQKLRHRVWPRKQKDRHIKEIAA